MLLRVLGEDSMVGGRLRNRERAEAEVIADVGVERPDYVPQAAHVEGSSTDETPLTSVIGSSRAASNYHEGRISTTLLAACSTAVWAAELAIALARGRTTSVIGSSRAVCPTTTRVVSRTTSTSQPCSNQPSGRPNSPLR